MIRKIINSIIGMILLGTATAGIAQNAGKSFPVRYLSSENIYLNAGKADSLAVGDTLAIIKAKKVVAKIEVAFVSEHSASCKILEMNGEVQPGDPAFLLTKKEKQIEKVQPADTTAPQRKIPAYKKEPVHRDNGFRLRGNVSIQLYYWKDLGPAGLNFTQPTARINLRGRRLWGKEFYLKIRTRTRYNRRTQALNKFAPREEWRNRIYEFSFAYSDETAPFNFQVGRIISNKFSGVGYIDGLLVQHNMSRHLRSGIFGGTQPDWQYADFQTSIQKYGAFVNYLKGDYSSGRMESTVAAAGEYHGSTVSREFVYLQNSYYSGRLWNIYQSAELDVNRGWRRSQGSNSLSLTSLYLSGRWHPWRWLSLGLSYNNRKNYRTYETRSIADSLFDDALRYGLRATTSITLPHNYRVFTNVGLRKRKTDSQYTYSYAGGINKVNFLFKQTSLFLNGAGFSNFFTNGFNFSARLSRNFLINYNFDVAIGGYLYQLKAAGTNRKNQWVRIGNWSNLFSNFYFSGQYEYDWGDDVKGHRVLAEFGYRF